MNVTETDFRQYDSALGRFNVMDMLSELAPDHTPYRYGFNNPVYWSDPTGLFETYRDAQKWIDTWGLSGAEISYNKYKNVYEISNDGYSFYQRGQDIISSMYSMDTGLTINIIKGGAGASNDGPWSDWSPEFGKISYSTVQPGSGRITPIGGAGDLLGIKEMAIGEVATATNNPYAGVILGVVAKKGKVSISNAIKSNSKNFKKITDSYLKNSGIDAHQLKRDFLGSKVSISRYDLYKDASGEILILQKGGVGMPIRTGEFIK